MGPEIMAGLAIAAEAAPAIGLAGTAATVAGTVYGAQSSADAMRAQAATDQARAAQQQQIAKAKAIEEQAAAQRIAGDELRSARLAQSRLGAVAGASGSSGSDPTVMKLWEGIEAEGQKNAAYATATGNQKAQGITYQAALDRWSADANAGIRRSGADATALGGTLSGIGQFASGVSAMALKYRNPSSNGSNRTGYGR